MSFNTDYLQAITTNPTAAYEEQTREAMLERRRNEQAQQISRILSDNRAKALSQYFQQSTNQTR